MRQVPNGKRSRNRPGRNNRPQHNRNQTFDSSGPEGKVRGTANQVYEKYLALARDASSSGDRVTAENFFQHAEHYFRIMVASGQQMRPRPFGEDGVEGDLDDAADGQPYPADQPQPQFQQPQHSQPQQHQGGRQHGPNGAPPRPPQAQAPQVQAAPQVQPQPVAAAPQVQPQPATAAPERRPETPAELAQAAAANAEGRERVVRRPRRGSSAPVDA